MAWGRRYRYTRRTGTNKDPYRSGLERRLSKVLVNCAFEARKLSYMVPKKYLPDFTFPDKDWLVIEAKGRFTDGSSEASKYVHCAKEHKEIEIVFILENPMVKAGHHVKVRKDGSFMTIGEWCCKNNFLFFPEKDIPEWFIEGDFDRDKLLELKRELKSEWLGVI